MSDTHEAVVQKMIDLYHMLVCHNGFGEMSVDTRILKRGQKEVIVRCGRQYRFVVDTPGPGVEREEWLTNWKYYEDEASCQIADTIQEIGRVGAEPPPTIIGAGRD